MARTTATVEPKRANAPAVQSPDPARPETRKGGGARPLDALFAPVDAASLVFFRVVFGFLVGYDIFAKALGGSVARNLVDPDFHFRYFGFGWVPHPPGAAVYGLVAVVVLSAAGIAAGLFYRISAVLFFLSFTWYFLLEQALYLNHFYFVSLLGLISIFLPANRLYSLDTIRSPAIRSDLVPAWTLWLLRFQLGVVYFYGGLAKINSDWLIAGEPVRTWAREWGAGTSLAPLFQSEAFVYFIAWGGMLFDLLIVPLLLWPRTRTLAVALAVFFHLSNAFLFNIGIFPLLSLAATLLFLPPSTHRQIVEWVRGTFVANPQIAAPRPNFDQVGFRARPWVLAGLCIYAACQLLFPFRHWLYPGSVHWTEEGHLFAWHMMLREKSHQAEFFARDRLTGKAWRIDPAEWLTERQARKMGSRPELILQFAHHLRDRLRDRGDFSIHAQVAVSLNARPPSLLIDPNADLGAISSSLAPAPWILPLGSNTPVPEWFLSAEPLSPRAR